MKRYLSLLTLAVLLATSLTSCYLFDPYGYSSDYLTTRDSHRHNWMEATCLSPAYCTECGETRGSKASHSFRVEERREASCTEEGCIVSVCSYCHAQKSEAIPTADHTPDPNGRCAVCGAKCNTDSVRCHLRTDAAHITLSGRIKQQCDVLDLNDHYDIAYLHERGYRSVRITVSMTVDVKAKGTQYVLLYPTSDCAEGMVNEFFAGDPGILHSYKFSMSPNAENRNVSFTCELPLSALPEGRIYIRYDACVGNGVGLLCPWQWANSNVSVTVEPV